MRKYVKLILSIVLCSAICLTSTYFPWAEAAQNDVELNELIVKWGGIVEMEPNFSMKTNSGKFGPQELEFGLMITPHMKYGYGNVDGMMAPLRDMIEGLPGTVEWDGSLNPGTVTVKLNDDVLVYTLGSVSAALNGRAITIPDQELAPYAYAVEGEIFDDSSQYYAFYLPVKFTAEALGAQVMWNEPMRRAEIGWILYYQEAALEPPTGGSFTTSAMEGSGSIAMSTIRSNPVDAVIACFGVAGYQNEDGGWQKTNASYDTTNNLFLQRFSFGHSTIDNGATIGQTHFLARVLQYLKREDASVLNSIGPTLQSQIPYTLDYLHDQGRIDKNNLSAENILAFVETTYWKSLQYYLDAQAFFYAPGADPATADPVSGGWRQYWPYSMGYFKNITYNDNAMSGVLSILMDMLYETKTTGSAFWDDFEWARDEVTQGISDISPADIQRTFDLGIRFVLDSQINVEGFGLTAWCQQYDPATGKPAMGRAYEHPSMATGESNTLVREVLMRIQSVEVTSDSGYTFGEVGESIMAHYKWTQSIAKTGLSTVTITDRTREIAGDRVVLPLLLADGSPNSATIFGRFYSMELDENGEFKMLFSGRDMVIVDDHNLVPHERRSGYSFTNTGTDSTAQTNYNAWSALTGNGYAWLLENGYLNP